MANLRCGLPLRCCITLAGAVGLCAMQGGAPAQTVINNGSNNTTQVIIQRAPAVVIERSVPARQLPAAPWVRPPSSFPYQQRDLLTYMSPRCAQLYELQLSGGPRRTGHSVRRDVSEEFRLNCQDAVSEAQKALYESRLRSYNLKQGTDRASQLAAERTKAEREQCDELLRILAGKRKRLPSMTDGERADHERAEVNYRGRCLI